MIKYVFLLLITQSFLFSAVWSLTRMSIATSGINPVLSQGMNSIIRKQEDINREYDKVLQENNITNKYMINDQKLDREILSELIQMNFILNQKLDIYSESITLNSLLLPSTQNITVPNTKEKSYNSHTNSNSSGNYSFGCVCAGVLSSAFTRIDTHLFSENLNPLSNKLDDLKPVIQDSISQIKKNKTNLQKEIDRLKLLVLKTREYIFELKKETPLRVEYKGKK